MTTKVIPKFKTGDYLLVYGCIIKIVGRVGYYVEYEVISSSRTPIPPVLAIGTCKFHRQSPTAYNCRPPVYPQVSKLAEILYT